ncbi:MAG: hypothetical protein WC897_02750 [Candidatus Gracilibacteria bacterium]
MHKSNNDPGTIERIDGQMVNHPVAGPIAMAMLVGLGVAAVRELTIIVRERIDAACNTDHVEILQDAYRDRGVTRDIATGVRNGSSPKVWFSGESPFPETRWVIAHEPVEMTLGAARGMWDLMASDGECIADALSL